MAVDQSAEMLAHVHGAETVQAPIAALDLGRSFDVVLLASHLINTLHAADRDGATAGPVRVELDDVRREGDLLSAIVRYWAGDELRTQTFTARRLDEDALRRALADAGLGFQRWLRPDRFVVAARATAR